MGPLDGIIDMRETVSDMAEGGADAVLMHKGLVRCGHRTVGRDLGLIVHLSASTSLTPMANSKTLVASVEEAIRLGADCGVRPMSIWAMKTSATCSLNWGAWRNRRITGACLCWL